MSESNYKATVINSSRTLSPIEKIHLKDTTAGVKLNDAVQTEKLRVQVDCWAVVQIHNETLEKPDYEVYVIQDRDGITWYTSSPSFWQSFKDIWDEMAEYGESAPAWGIEIFTMPSKNQANNPFITCTIFEA